MPICEYDKMSHKFGMYIIAFNVYLHISYIGEYFFELLMWM